MQKYDNGILRDLTDEEMAEWEASQQDARPAVPQQVSMGQAREALYNANLLDTVDAAIAAIPEPDMKRRAELAWEYRPTVERASPFVAMLAQMLELGDGDLDQLFIDAAKL